MFCRKICTRKTKVLLGVPAISCWQEAMGIHSTEQQQQLCKLQSSLFDSEQRLRQQCEEVAHRLLTASESSEVSLPFDLCRAAYTTCSG